MQQMTQATVTGPISRDDCDSAPIVDMPFRMRGEGRRPWPNPRLLGQQTGSKRLKSASLNHAGTG
jgi:hypothetical protein